MKVSFFTNYLNHHQLPFCMEMDKLTRGNYRFIALRTVPGGRLALGYGDANEHFPFVLKAYAEEDGKKKAEIIVDASDAVIVGAAPDECLKMGIRKGKITLKYSERICKQGKWKVFLPRYFRHILFRNKHLYMLCASAYTAYDYSLIGAYINKTYKWGYFPEVKRYDLDVLFAGKKKEKVLILWCGRMIGWKHPEAAIEIAQRLKRDGYDFEMNFIGGGPMEDELRETIRKKDLEDCVRLLGTMSPEMVRNYMECADIFLFTSDFNEGWGAVLNESMNSGCAVVASHAIGSVPFLIRHGKNGLIYKNGNTEDLYKKTKRLVDSVELRRSMGEKAYHTIADLWNAEVAAKRLLQLIEELQKHGQCDLFEDGPCSRAEIMRNNWFYERD